MRILRTFELPNTKLLTVKFDGEEFDALEKLRSQWSSVDFLRNFFTLFKKDYMVNYGKSNLSKVVFATLDLADDLFKKLYQVAQEPDLDSLSGFFKPLDNRESENENYEFQKLKAKGEERKSYLRIYALRYQEMIIVTGGAIKLTDRMGNRKHTTDELKKLDLVKTFLDKDNPELEYSYFDVE